MKKGVMISISVELHSQIKERGINLSEVCEKAIIKELGRDINLDKPSCHYCHKHDDNMVWDGYLELWCCEKCNKKEIKKVSIMALK